jgi:ankyrin repeat protein
MIAAAQGHEATVRTLLDAGADPNVKNDLGRTSLMFASSYGYVPIVTMLLAKGAGVNRVPDDENGWTALMAAAYNGHAEVALLLLKSGANHSILDKRGKTALALAEMRGQTAVIKVLSENGATR